MLGFAFGTVCAHVFDSQVEEILRMLLPWLRRSVGGAFIYSVVSSAIIYSVVFTLFRSFYESVEERDGFSMWNADKLWRGSRLMKYMLGLSIVYNLILCVDPTSRLMKYATARMATSWKWSAMLAPGLLGCHKL